MAIKPMMNFAMQLKHLPKGVNKQAFIDRVCNVRKVDALRATEDLGQYALDALHVERRMQAYEAFSGINVRSSMDSFWAQNSSTNGKAGKIRILIDEIKSRINTFYSKNPARKVEEELRDDLNQQIKNFEHYQHQAKSLGIDISDLDIDF